MEVRGQDKEIGMPSSFPTYNPPNNNRDSSSKVSSTPTLLESLEERRIGHANHHRHPLYHHQLLNPQPTRDPDLTSDPPPATAPIAPTTAIATTNTATATPTIARSISRSSPPGSSPSTPPVRYRECLKNHAAIMGGHVVDGCGEFMPSGMEGTLEALKCAACECHRNFHRKEVEGEGQYVAASCYKSSMNSPRINALSHHQQQQQFPSSLNPQPQQLPHHHHHQQRGYPMSASTALIPPMMMTFGGDGRGGTAAESSSEDLNMFRSSLPGGQPTSLQVPSMSKKRFRTKFSKEQKERMKEFADKVGWKMQKQDEQEVQRFCSQVGVKRKVFKVWMHNNKQAMKKKQM